MLAEERFNLILDLLARQRTATVQELCDHRSQWNKKHDANDAEQLSAQQGGQ